MTSLNAAALEVHKKGDRVLLQDACASGQDDVASLFQWTQNTGSNKKCTNFAPIESGRQCTYDITDCVPDHVVKYQDSTPANDGPNCWNLSLVMSGILPSLRYATPEEMNFFMAPPLCRQLKNKEPRKPGDVGAIRTVSKGNIQEAHGFIYISDKLAYSKNGYSKLAPYALQPLDSVMETYEVPEKKVCRSNEINPKAECETAVSYYRCESMDSYLKKHKNISEEVRDNFKKIDAVENCVSNQAIKGNSLSSEAKKNIEDTGKALLAYVQSAKNSPDFKKMNRSEQDFVVGSLYLRMGALSEQLADSNEYDTGKTLNDLTLSFASAAQELPKGK